MGIVQKLQVLVEQHDLPLARYHSLFVIHVYGLFKLRNGRAAEQMQQDVPHIIDRFALLEDHGSSDHESKSDSRIWSCAPGFGTNTVASQPQPHLLLLF